MDITSLEPTNKIPQKFFNWKIRQRGDKDLGSSVIYSPLSPSSLLNFDNI